MRTLDDMEKELAELRKEVRRLKGDDTDVQQAAIEQLTGDSSDPVASTNGARTGESRFSRLVAKPIQEESERRHNDLIQWEREPSGRY
jgi:hypothetical protein